MRKVWLILLSLILFSGCHDAGETIILKEGKYTGTFHRMSPYARYISADVTLVLEDGKFSGTSSESYYPAICEGTYSVSGDQVEFSNTCVWTANFNWSFILSGTFEIESAGEEVMLYRSYDEGMQDTYQLKLQLE